MTLLAMEWGPEYAEEMGQAQKITGFEIGRKKTQYESRV